MKPRYKSTALLLSLTVFAVYALCFKGQTAPTIHFEKSTWNESLAKQYLAETRDASKWDQSLLQRKPDDQRSASFIRPINYGTCPVPKHAPLGKVSLSGAGASSNLKKIKFYGRSIAQTSCGVHRTSFTTMYHGSKLNETFLKIHVLTDFVDITSDSHANVRLVSRKNPSNVCEGLFKMKHDAMDYPAYLTASRDECAVVAMQSFNLNDRRTVLVVPKKDGSLRSMKIKGPVPSIQNTSFVGDILRRPDEVAFFKSKGTI